MYFMISGFSYACNGGGSGEGAGRFLYMSFKNRSMDILKYIYTKIIQKKNQQKTQPKKLIYMAFSTIMTMC